MLLISCALLPHNSTSNNSASSQQQKKASNIRYMGMTWFLSKSHVKIINAPMIGTGIEKYWRLNNL